MTKIIPVIHFENDEQALRNAQRAFDSGNEGVFLIEMNGRNGPLPHIARQIKDEWPDKLVGINFLGADPCEAALANIKTRLDMTWTDAQLSHSQNFPWDEADKLTRILTENPEHLMFTGVAFKHQAYEPYPSLAAQLAIDFGFVPTTSGTATGVAAESQKIAIIREEIGPDAPLAIASGITPENAHEFAPHLSHILVATGVCSSFYEFDYAKLCDLRSACHQAV